MNKIFQNNGCFFAEMKNDVFSLSTSPEHCSAGWGQDSFSGTRLHEATNGSVGRWGGSCLDASRNEVCLLSRKREVWQLLASDFSGITEEKVLFFGTFIFKRE